MIPLIPAVDESTVRTATCDCGRTFEQRRVDERWMDALATHRSGAAAAIARTIPELYVPRFCPRCERKQLTLEAQLAAVRSERREVAV